MDEGALRAIPALRSLLSGWLPVVAWTALIFALSAQPNLRFASDPGLDFVVRKLGHIGVFGILALLLWRDRPGGDHRLAPAVGLGLRAGGPLRGQR